MIYTPLIYFVSISSQPETLSPLSVCLSSPITCMNISMLRCVLNKNISILNTKKDIYLCLTQMDRSIREQNYTLCSSSADPIIILVQLQYAKYPNNIQLAEAKRIREKQLLAP